MAFTYNTLKTAIQNFAEDDSIEFVSTTDTFIEMAQERLLRDLDTYGFDIVVSAVGNIGNPYIFLPTSPSKVYKVKNFTWVTSTGKYVQTERRTDEFLRDYWPESTSVGETKYWAPWCENQAIYIAPAMASAWTIYITYTGIPTKLDASNTTNWFTDFAYNALFYACMVEACSFMKNPSMIQVWEARYDKEIDRLRGETRRTRYDDMRRNKNPDGSPDSFDGGP